jgi:hypothetical protein
MTKLAVILGVPIALLATIASLGVVVVDVREGGPDGHRIVVPVPLVFAQAALALAPVVAPADKLRIPDNEALQRQAERDVDGDVLLLPRHVDPQRAAFLRDHDLLVPLLDPH